MRFDRVGIIAGLALAALSVSLAACSTTAATSTPAGTASIRFINGSPDAGAFDVLINGTVIASNVAYGQITAYQSQNIGTTPLPQVAFVKTGTKVNIFPPLAGNAGQTFQLGSAPGTKITVIVEGRAAFPNSALGLAVGSFIEPTIANTAGQYAIVFHHASPAANAASPTGLDVGQIALGNAPIYTVQGQLLFNTISGTTQSLFGVSGLPAVVGPPGVGFFAGAVAVSTATPVPVTSTSPTPTPSPMPPIYAAILPGPPTAFPTPTGNPIQVSGVDASNVNQSMPFNSDQVLFVYLIDDAASATGVQLIGTFTN